MTVGVMLKILLKDKIRQTEDANASLREVKKNEKKGGADNHSVSATLPQRPGYGRKGKNHQRMFSMGDT